MSGEDDDDFWANEDFIATIENVVKKAEEASAAKHGGTPPSAATPLSSAVPPQTSNSRSVEGNSSILGAPVAHGIPSSKLTNGFASQPPHAFPGHALLPGEQARGAPYPPTLPSGPQVPMQSMTQSAAQEERRDGRSQPSQGVNPSFLWHLQTPSSGGGQVESERYREAMAEKDGAISNPCSRVQQAEQQRDEARKRVGPQYLQQALHSSVDQQRELQRLSAQLLFKDHELREAQNARVNKEECLRNALAETAALKEELNQLKKISATGTQLKRPRENDTDVSEKIPECGAIALDLVCASPGDAAGVAKQSHDPWSPPWIPEGPFEDMQGRTAGGWQGKSSKNVLDLGRGLKVQDESSSLATGKVQSEANGFVSSDGKEAFKSDNMRADEFHRRDHVAISRSCTGVGGDEEASCAHQGMNRCSRTSEICYSLQQIWGLKGVKNDGISLVSKLYANCRQEMYVLLSSREFQNTSGPISSHEDKQAHPNSVTVSEKLHAALAKVANGFSCPEIIITPLLELCKLDNVNIVGSALHVLRCILHHDETCRKNILLRGSQRRTDCQIGSLASSDNLEKQEKGVEGKGWFVKTAAKGSNTGQTTQVIVFSSPRILHLPQSGVNLVQSMYNNRDPVEKDLEIDFYEPPKPFDQLQQPAQQQNGDVLATSGDNSAPAKEFSLFIKWLLRLALTSSSTTVKYEAVAIIGVLVMNSEPLVERAMFGPLLCLGGMELLLKQSAGEEIWLQAIRIVHLLLYCPRLFQNFFAVGEDEQGTRLQVQPAVARSMGTTTRSLEKEKEILVINDHDIEPSVGQRLDKSNTAVAVASGSPDLDPDLSKVKLLEGIAECLKPSGRSLQRYALYRSVIRLLTFIATSGNCSVAFLMRAGASHDDVASQQSCKDDSKLEGTVGGESASGQLIAGDGSGSLSHLKGLDIGNKGSGHLLGLVDKDVDDLESVQNIPQRLVALIDSELDIDENDSTADPSLAEERDCLIHEAVTLLCQLASHKFQSPVVIGHLVSNKNMARLTISVTNRLIDRKSRLPPPESPWQRPAAPRNSDVVELAKCLRRRILCSLAEP